MLPERYKGGIVSFRNDRMGARILALLNTIRIARDYDLPYFFTWMTHGRSSEELQAPTEIFDADWFEAHFVSHDDFRSIDGVATDVATLPVTSTAEVLTAGAAGGEGFLCMGTDLVVLPWESAEDVSPRYAAAIEELVFAAPVRAAMAAVDAALADSGTAFHIRRGDIIHDPVTSNQLWSNKYIPREFYEVLAERLLEDDSAKILVFSDEPVEIARLKAAHDRIMTPDDVLPEGLTLAQRDFMEIYAMSRCQQIIGPPGSGFSIAAALIGNRPIRDVTTLLNEADNASALDRLVSRIAERSDLFLSDGDLGQSLPFACDHLNAAGRGEEALTLLEGLADEGFAKLYVFKLHLEQLNLARRFDGYRAVVERFRTAELDPALPARVEQHWSEVCRVASVVAANAGEVEDTRDLAAMAFWHGGGNRLVYNTFSVLLARGKVVPESFPIPFDPEVRRPVPAAFGPRPGTEGVDGDVPEAAPQWVMPPDIIARDWQFFLGKTLNRGFDTPGAIGRALELFDLQFARACPAPAVASVRGLYLAALGRYEEALKAHHEALTADADHPLYLKRMAAAMLAQDAEDRTARVLLEKAAQVAPAQPIYRGELAQCLFQQGETDRAIELMANVAREIAALPEPAFLAARMMRQARKVTDETLALVDLALARAPHVRRFMVMRANVLGDLGRQDATEEALNDIIRRYGEGGDLKALRARLAA